MKNAKMRIFFVITQAEWGGAQTFVYKACLEARSRGYEVLVAAGGQGELEQRCRDAGIAYTRWKSIRRNINPLWEIQPVFELASIIQGWKPDVLFLFSAKAGVIGAVAAAVSGMRRRMRVVYRIGGWSFLDPISNFQKQIRMWSERLVAPLKDAIIVQHPGDEALAHARHIRPRESIVVISNGLDIRTFDQALLAQEEARKKLEALYEQGIVQAKQPEDARVASTDPLIVTIANFYATKDLSNFLHAIKIVKQDYPRARFLVMGDGGDQRDAIHALRTQLGLESSVAFPGAVSHAQTLLSGADLFVLSSAKEGNPWALHEAMAARLPCVVTDVGACKWILSQGTETGNTAEPPVSAGWVVPPQNSEALAQAMLDALTHPEEAKRRGEIARRIAETYFTEQEMWEKTFRVLQPPSTSR